jgi:Na+-translocating ferredoxin:NAD+ oxidoreductase RnfG subunit
VFGSKFQITRFTIAFLAIMFMSSGLPKGMQKKVTKEINAVFTLTEFDLVPKEFSAEALTNLKTQLDTNRFFEIQSNNKLMGYAFLGVAPSKTDIFDFLVLFDTDLIIKKTKVLAYREDYGGEIGSKRWLKQFIGKSTDDSLKVGNGIAAISGATISVESMTKEMNNLLNCLHKMKQNNQF